MADTRSYEADVARVLRDYYAREMGADDVAKVAEVAAKVAAEVLTGATFYASSDEHLDDLAQMYRDAWYERGYIDGVENQKSQQMMDAT